MATHPPETVYVGDDWVLLRALGSAAPGIALEWVLATRGALAQVIAPGAAVVEVIDEAAGSVSVRVPRDLSATITPGRYIDGLRVVAVDGTITTEVVGQLEVVNPGFIIQPGDSPSGDSPS
jgi:hypothetical protein